MKILENQEINTDIGKILLEKNDSIKILNEEEILVNTITKNYGWGTAKISGYYNEASYSTKYYCIIKMDLVIANLPYGFELAGVYQNSEQEAINFCKKYVQQYSR